MHPAKSSPRVVSRQTCLRQPRVEAVDRKVTRTPDTREAAARVLIRLELEDVNTGKVRRRDDHA
jgi:hypothetical protein